MGGDEVLQHVHPLAEVGRDGVVDRLAGRVRHQPANAGHLPHLPQASAGAALHHHEDGVPRNHVLGDLIGDVLRGPGPKLALLVQVLVVGQKPHLVIVLGGIVLDLGRPRDLGLLRRDDDRLDAEADAALRRPMVAQRLDGVQHLDDPRPVDLVVGLVQQAADLLLAQLVVHVAQVVGDDAVEQRPPRRRFEEDAGPLRSRDVLGPVHDDRLPVRVAVLVAPHGLAFPRRVLPQPDAGVDVNHAVIVGGQHVLDAGEVHPLALQSGLHVRQVVDAEDDILRRRHDGPPAGR